MSTEYLQFLAQASAQSQPSLLMQMLPLLLMLVGFWFLLIQPQRKKQKLHQQMLTELKPGDHVVTNGGIFGTITLVKKDRFQIKIDENTRIYVLKAAVQSKDTDDQQQ